ncbi:MAG: hypothetical protein J0L99_02845 [Chitinophagales bacterium]|nr:hypothetical protein [Chitinophagales bacterium]
MLKRTLILLLCIGSLVPAAHAQRSKDKKKDDVQIIEFGEDGGRVRKQKQEKKTGIIVKTSPTSFLMGRQPFEIEREVSSLLSLQVGLGLRFKPLIQSSELNQEISGSAFVEETYFCESDQWGGNDICDDILDYSIRKMNVGPIISFSPRLFFESDGYEGGYIAPVLRYSSLSGKVSRVVEDPINLGVLTYEETPSQKESIRDIDLMVHYGQQSLFPKLTFEYFIGLGARIRSGKVQDIGFNDLGFIQNGERTLKSTNIRIEAGIRVGLQL